MTDFEKCARLHTNDDGLPWLQQEPRCEKMVLDNRQRRNKMGDKGGKKDKEKGQKQNTEKQKQKERSKLDRQPKRKP